MGAGGDAHAGLVTEPDGAPRPAIVARLLSRCSFPDPGEPVDCAVSGGADSLALLVLAVAAGCRVTAWHVDHGLRPGSDAEAAVVADVAGRHGAAFRSLPPTVATAQLESLSTKQRELIAAVASSPTVIEAADRLEVSRSNVYASLRRIARKLGVATVSDLVVLARAGGLS